MEELHISRHWDGPGRIEQECPCPKAACDMVISRTATCPQHAPEKSVRSGHRSSQCPAAAG